MNIEVIETEFDVTGLLSEFKTSVENLLSNINTTPPVLVQKMYCIYNGIPNSIINQMPITQKTLLKLKGLIEFKTMTYRVVMPNTCYTWHTDKNLSSMGKGINHHIPLITNEGCHFVYDNESYHMPANGSLYKVNNNIPHSFMNAGRTPRVHILFEN